MIDRQICRMGLRNSSEEKDFCWRRGLDLELNINKSSHVVGKNRLEYVDIYKCTQAHTHTLQDMYINLQLKLFGEQKEQMSSLQRSWIAWKGCWTSFSILGDSSWYTDYWAKRHCKTYSVSCSIFLCSVLRQLGKTVFFIFSEGEYSNKELFILWENPLCPICTGAKSKAACVESLAATYVFVNKPTHILHGSPYFMPRSISFLWMDMGTEVIPASEISTWILCHLLLQNCCSRHHPKWSYSIQKYSGS